MAPGPAAPQRTPRSPAPKPPRAVTQPTAPASPASSRKGLGRKDPGTMPRSHSALCNRGSMKLTTPPPFPVRNQAPPTPAPTRRRTRLTSPPKSRTTQPKRHPASRPRHARCRPGARRRPNAARCTQDETPHPPPPEHQTGSATHMPECNARPARLVISLSARFAATPQGPGTPPAPD